MKTCVFCGAPQTRVRFFCEAQYKEWGLLVCESCYNETPWMGAVQKLREMEPLKWELLKANGSIFPAPRISPKI